MFGDFSSNSYGHGHTAPLACYNFFQVLTQILAELPMSRWQSDREIYFRLFHPNSAAERAGAEPAGHDITGLLLWACVCLAAFLLS